jgi:ADP-dependent NAD(P)H-hydrate dehydratase / NAD(P)H-hydrate epimerase
LAAEPAALLTAAEMRRWDERATAGHGVPERVLMESAGREAARLVQRLYPEGPVVAAVGRGNNGGDALVLLRTLRAWGREVLAVPAGGGIAAPELLHGWELATAPPDDEAAFRGAGVVVDGLLGTGASGAPRDPEAGLVRRIAAAGRPVVALDGPTGVDLSDGSVAGEAVRAQVTVTFGAAKRGLVLFPGRAHAGRVIVVETGFPPLGPAGAGLITGAWARRRLPRPRPNAHKGELGTVVLVAGRAGMGGAAIMLAMGALRAGAGGVRVLSVPEVRSPLQAAVPEAIFLERGTPEADDALAAADAVVAGPGIGTDAAALAVLRRVLERSQAPLLLDADALTLLARGEASLPGDADAARLLLTPHPGEMARLLGTDAKAVAADPFAHAERAVARFGCAVLLKGFPSLVAAPGEPPLVNVAGHAGIATGGMGDTLGGVVGALLGMGAPARDAAAVGLHLAGRAAELAGRGRSLLPRDVVEALPEAIAEVDAAGPAPEPGVLLDLPPAG